MPIQSYLLGLAVMSVMACLFWLASVVRRDVSIVDSLWSLMFLAGGLTYIGTLTDPGPRSALLAILVAIWALRLSAYITWRNWGEGEDRRYVAIRERNEPGFALKSLYLVFLLQAVLAWVISLPLLGAAASAHPIGILDWAGVMLWAVGLVFESVGDFQLARFRRNPGNRGKVLDKGLWRYTRHPNYFGDFCVWWGFYLIALSAGAWWTLPGPLLMTVLLLKVSGVALLEKDLSERRPEYRIYMQTTNAFFPGVPQEKNS